MPPGFDPSAWSPERIGLAAFSVGLLALVVRAALKGTWVPSIYYAELKARNLDMKAERDAALLEARKANDTSASLSGSLAKALDSLGELTRRGTA